MQGSQEWVSFIAPILASLPQRAAPFFMAMDGRYAGNAGAIASEPWMACTPGMQEQFPVFSQIAWNHIETNAEIAGANFGGVTSQGKPAR
ncbi:MAG: hypothetical protein ABIQ70_05750 [Dokdonella sp.]